MKPEKRSEYEISVVLGVGFIILCAIVIILLWTSPYFTGLDSGYCIVGTTLYKESCGTFGWCDCNYGLCSQCVPIKTDSPIGRLMKIEVKP